MSRNDTYQTAAAQDALCCRRIFRERTFAMNMHRQPQDASAGRVGSATDIASGHNRWLNGWKGEPGLAEILDDPIVQILMSHDRVSREEIETIASRHAA
ncbi:hypothetical protein VQ042_07910 [Aurantimonas sp. A2-1-M11]|uniref:hypothetical protein n=1 Tax=Aurantimonas sp. A2-1-M11 TaxID=3113712 RepID=UPI002F94904F